MKKMLSVIIALMMVIGCFTSVSAAGLDITVTGEGTGKGEAANGVNGAVWGQMTEEGMAIEFEAAGVKGVITVSDSAITVADLNNQQAYMVTFETLNEVAQQLMSQVMEQVSGDESIDALFTILSAIDVDAISNLVMKYVSILAGVVNESNMTMEAGEYTLPVYGDVIEAQIVTIAPTAEDWSNALNQVVSTLGEDAELKAVIASVVKTVLAVSSPEEMGQLSDEQLDAMMSAAVDSMIAQITEQPEALEQVAQMLGSVSVKVVAAGEVPAEISVTVAGQTIGVVMKAVENEVQCCAFMAAEDQYMPIATAAFGMDGATVYAEIAVPMADFSAECAFVMTEAGIPVGSVNVKSGEMVVSLDLAPAEAGLSVILNVTEGAEDTMTITVDITGEVRDIDAYDGEVTEITAEMLMGVLQQALAGAMA